MTTAADTFREIANLTAEARRALDDPDFNDRRSVRCHLVGLQASAQNGLRDALANQPKLEAYPCLLAGTQKMVAALRKLANEFDGCAVAYREVADDAQDAIGKPGSEVDLTELLAFTRKADKWLRHRVQDFTKCAVEYRSVADALDAGLATIPQQQHPENEQAALVEAFAALANKTAPDAQGAEGRTMR